MMTPGGRAAPTVLVSIKVFTGDVVVNHIVLHCWELKALALGGEARKQILVRTPKIKPGPQNHSLFPRRGWVFQLRLCFSPLPMCFNPPRWLLLLFQVWVLMSGGAPPASPLLTPAGSLQGGQKNHQRAPRGAKTSRAGRIQTPNPITPQLTPLLGAQQQNKAPALPGMQTQLQPTEEVSRRQKSGRVKKSRSMPPAFRQQKCELRNQGVGCKRGGSAHLRSSRMSSFVKCNPNAN